MKNLLVLVFSLLTLSACDNVLDSLTTETNIIPLSFSIDLPSSISSDANGTTTSQNSRLAEGDTIAGAQVYNNLNLFIHLAERSAKDVEGVLAVIHEMEINSAMAFSFASQEDERVKNVAVEENVAFEGENWEYCLTITDARAEEFAPEQAIALQFFWQTEPLKGVVLFKYYNMHRPKGDTLTGVDPANDYSQLMQRIDYSEEASADYDKSMTIQVNGFPRNLGVYSIDNIRMFIGKKGELIDIKGNSNHSEARFYTDQQGFSWSFVASAHHSGNYSVAEVGLPPISLNTDKRETLLKTYSVKNVLAQQIKEKHPDIPDAWLDEALFNTGAPAFFGSGGFIGGQIMPDKKYEQLITRINGLSPYNPTVVANTEINFLTK